MKIILGLWFGLDLNFPHYMCLSTWSQLMAFSGCCGASLEKEDTGQALGFYSLAPLPVHSVHPDREGDHQPGTAGVQSHSFTVLGFEPGGLQSALAAELCPKPWAQLSCSYC